ncbi:MAG: hypothetical protein ABT940_07980, partial [Alphaproteobacteria bacterium]
MLVLVLVGVGEPIGVPVGVPVGVWVCVGVCAHAFALKGKEAPKWYLVDANNLVVGKLSTILSRV